MLERIGSIGVSVIELALRVVTLFNRPKTTPEELEAAKASAPGELIDLNERRLDEERRSRLR